MYHMGLHWMDKPLRLTLEEVNERLPAVQHHLEQIVRHRQMLVECHELLAEDGIDVEQNFAAEAADAPDVARLKDTYRQCLKAIAAEIRAIESLGALIKDLNLGLVDFYGEFEGRVVFFCWQFGEREVLYWHELDEGFSGRHQMYHDREPSCH